MDRGIKIAILCACLLSLGLGIVWDSVIDVVRPAPHKEENRLGMAPDRISASIGEAGLADQRPQVLATDTPYDGGASEEEVPVIVEVHHNDNAASADGEWPAHIAPFIKDGKYIMQDGDNFSRLADRENRFRFLKDSKGITWMDWEQANSQLDPRKIRAGTAVNIPTK